MSIVVIDYGLGNTKSVVNALKNQGAEPLLSNEPEVIAGAEGVILPGVGAFPHGMNQLRRFDLVDPLIRYAQSGRPLLGICLGMQMLLSRGLEFVLTPGLGLIAGEVVPLASEQGLYGRIPHVGWSPLIRPTAEKWDDTILHNIDSKTEAYFVHSFIANPAEEKTILASTPYQGIAFCSAIREGNIYGCQFHPEKSGLEGLKILENFLKIAKGAKE